MPRSRHQLCQVTLLGNLVAKPEIRYQANPVLAVTELTLATTHRWQDKQQQTKEWTSYHQIKVVGNAVEEAIAQANKGDLLLVSGYLATNSINRSEIVHATTVEHFAKGFTPNINQVICSAELVSNVELVTSERGQPFAHFDVAIAHQAYSEQKQQLIDHNITRTVQVWGHIASQLHQQASLGANLVIEGRLTYANDAEKTQQITAKSVHVLLK
ncbi:single-stranded DNA-binding protein [Thalassotalea euphylliae]|uniref:Plasmid-derived single-stranded DNA-binding protein n=1 Tax=Thalassotalea euphylliae TaxID=1655234 RepID=A0A3E0U3A4_9GAMM|nr:single-stranded DNA-binding protein [Thalassotalea euphylliae]REL31461.1 single-stranded DNA-binding protein [Thalassotalea euphylliae]